MSALHLHPFHSPKPHLSEPSAFKISQKYHFCSARSFARINNFSSFPKIRSLFASDTQNLQLIALCSNYNTVPSLDPSADDLHPPPDRKYNSHDVNNFWGAVSLIIGTAVGPGMLGLPAATIRSGPLPSSIAILFSYVYVVSSIILVAELSFAAMEEDGVQEVSFTGLVTKAFGAHFGSFVALVYASLSLSLLVACVSGIGSIVHHCFPAINPITANALFPFLVGATIMFFPFNAIDGANRALCSIMLISIAALVAFGLSAARRNIVASFAFSSWRISSILPAIPITVLTLGFHVVTPFVCKLCRHNRAEALRAIVFGGAVPMVMVLSWNLIVLAISGSRAPASGGDPISLLLSVNPSASSAVQLFAFSALATSLIGYAVSFPKQLLDTMKLIFHQKISTNQLSSGSEVDGKATNRTEFDPPRILMLMFVLGSPVMVASFFHSAFSRALDFAEWVICQAGMGLFSYYLALLSSWEYAADQPPDPELCSYNAITFFSGIFKATATSNGLSRRSNASEI